MYEWVECVPLKFCITKCIPNELFFDFLPYGFSQCDSARKWFSVCFSNHGRFHRDVIYRWVFQFNLPCCIKWDYWKVPQVFETHVIQDDLRFPKRLGQIFTSCILCIQWNSSQSYWSFQSWTFQSWTFPLSLLCDMWVRPDITQYQTYNSYFSDLRQCITKGYQLAKQSLAIAGEYQWQYCERGKKLPVLKQKDEVLILLPDKSETLLSSWQGPFLVFKHSSAVN